MSDFLSTYWPHFLTAISLVLGTVAAIHATMTKRNVRSAAGWVGVIMLSPIVGALIYAIAGVNRMWRETKIARRSARYKALERVLSQYAVDAEVFTEKTEGRLKALKTVGDKVSHHPVTSGNQIVMFESGDATYDAMCAEIAAAKHGILLETYIFDRDPIGLRVADCLIAARKRGVAVRVLVDAVGARYSTPSILGYLKDGGVEVDAFNGKVIFGLRLPYSNLRTHRKILVVDGHVAFVGGMNIRAGFTGPKAARDTHFRVRGPVVADLFAVAADDWAYETGQGFEGPEWRLTVDHAEPGEGLLLRAVVSGPDRHLETNQKIMMGAFSVAERSIRIMSPYFLPDSDLASALATAARRGVEVDIIVPEKNNLALVSHAMNAQFEPLIRDGCRIWRATGPFDHSKLLVVDDAWAYIGSSNLDSRSLRLNFEIDLEIYDRDFARLVGDRIERSHAEARLVTLASLRSRPFLYRLFDRVLWLASPYL
ncbi:cardiolipin synthase [Rhizobium alvei]|uniref:Cardiolipin synthase n=1 Tax=Rhizobium alvei TaxID=1132659 RepID=A0ABT8YIK1_9HYPH|nr:cardiolipin synthase [Rhizobium alvei]MDO6963500.1 cardiolipin synthase [Rhizobium alvei]